MQASKDSRKWYFLFLICFLFGATMLSAADKHVDLLSKKITLDVEDGQLSHILSSIAKMSDCNIVLAVERKGEDDKKSKLEQNKITVHLNEVPIEQALSLVVKCAGLSYRIVGESTFLVGDKERINEEVGERSYVINLNYIDAEKVTKALEILPGKAVEITGQNSILLRANPETFAEISTRIEELDVPQKQIEIRARIIEISVKDSKKLGIDWSRLNHLTTIIAEDPNANGVGLPYSYGATDDGLTHGEPTDFGKLPDEQYFQMMDEWDNNFHFSRQLTAFDITVDWLLQNNAAKILTDTRITALNGELANIHIGEVVPFVVTDKEYEISVEREEVGIKLEVQPKVNKDGQITTTIAPEVSSVAELVGGYVPRVKKRTVKSTITVPDGSKIIVGGLLNSELINTENKVPFLSSIPYVGKWLFTHYVEEVYTTDLIIEITPRVVDVETEQVEYEVDSRLNRPLIRELN